MGCFLGHHQRIHGSIISGELFGWITGGVSIKYLIKQVVVELRDRCIGICLTCIHVWESTGMPKVSARDVNAIGKVCSLRGSRDVQSWNDDGAAPSMVAE